MTRALLYIYVLLLSGLVQTLDAQNPEPNRLFKSLSREKSQRNIGQLPAYNLFEEARLSTLTLRSTSLVETSTIAMLKMSSLARLRRTQPAVLQLDIPYGGEVLSLELYHESATSADFLVRTPGGVHPVEVGMQYHGVIKGDEQSIAAITIFEDEVVGIISTASLGNLVIGKWTNQVGTHVIYKEQDLKISPAFSCDADDTEVQISDKMSEKVQAHDRSAATCIKIYLEASYKLYQDKGSISSVVNFVTGFFNGVTAIYSNEGLNLEMSELFVWDIADPYSHGSSNSALNTFESNRPTFNGDLAHLLDYSGSNNGGIANIGVLCNPTANYAYSDIANDYSFPTYSWTVNVVAHEIGHNFGSPHTHACKWGPSHDKALDDCYETEGGCGSGPNPGSGGGTIMSYCHLGSGPGIDFSNGFGSEPGDLIRSAAASAGCLTDCGSGGTSGCNLVITDVTATDASCGLNNGKLTVEVSGAVGALTYDVGFGAQSTGVFTQLPPGDYTITVNNGLTCQRQTTASINLISQNPVINATVTNATCGQSDGQIQLSGSGGNSPYSYRVGNKTKSDPLFTDLAEGSYSAVLTDDNGCSVSKEVVIYTDDPPTMGVEVDHTKCGESNGKVSIQVTGGQGPYSYQLGNQTNENGVFTDLEDGSYEAIIRDANDCLDNQGITIKASSAISANADVVHTDCGHPNGSISIDASGGSGQLEYSIGGQFTAESSFESLQAGSYTLTVRDANYCTISLEKEIQGSETFSLNLSTVSTYCGLDNGIVSIEVDGDSGPYQYKIGNQSYSDQPVFENLPAGMVQITTRDDVGCETQKSIEVPKSSNPELKPIVDHTHCGLDNGTIEAAVESGIGPFHFDIGFGVQSESNFNNLPSGEYLLHVSDAKGCLDSLSVTIDSSSAVYSETSVVPTRCGMDNGSVRLNVLSGLAPFRFVLNELEAGEGGFEKIPAGTYDVMVIDADNCTYSEEVVVDSSPAIELVPEVAATTCDRQNGLIEIDATGGTGPLEYTLDSVYSGQDLYDNLLPGSYLVSVRDSVECIVEELVVVEPSSTPTISASVDHTTCGEDNGVIALSVGRGVEPYQYFINDQPVSERVESLSPGNYPLRVKDVFSCEDTMEVVVESSTAPIIEYATLPASCFQSNGTVIVNPSSGVAPYTFLIGNQISKDSVLSGVDSGYHLLRLMDDLGCEDTALVLVSYDDQYAKPQLPDAASICEGEPAVLDSRLDDLPQLTWTLDGNLLDLNSPMITARDPGSYKVVATYHEGCKLEASSMLTVRNKPDYVLPDADTICLGQFFQIHDESSDNSYDWTNDSSGKEIAFTSTSEYGLRTTNQFGCYTDQKIFVEVIQPVSSRCKEVH